MSRIMSGLWPIAALWLCVAPGNARAGAPAESVIGVLTPAVPPVINFGHATLAVLPFSDIAAVESLRDAVLTATDAARTRRLSAKARADDYFPAQRLSTALVASMQAAGSHAAMPLTVERSTRGGPGPVRLDELPEPGGAALLLDVSVLRIVLGREVGTKLHASFVATYRLLDPQGALIRPSRTLQSFHRRSTTDQCPNRAASICFDPDPSCEFNDIDDAEASGPRLWGCIDKALQSLAEAIARDLKV